MTTMRPGSCQPSVGLSRYLTQHLAKLPLGLAPRLVVTNDAPMALAPLLLKAPWVRVQAQQLEQYTDGQWQPLKPEDKGRLCAAEAQVGSQSGVQGGSPCVGAICWLGGPAKHFL